VSVTGWMSPGLSHFNSLIQYLRHWNSNCLDDINAQYLATRPNQFPRLMTPAQATTFMNRLRAGEAVRRCLPSDLGAGTTAEIEEERRLLYVAMTRAKDDLHLIVPQRFFTYGQSAQGARHVYASRTRFIPEGLLDLFDRTSWPPVAVGATARARRAKACASTSVPICAGCGGEVGIRPRRK
jgi:hypothetical protein